MKSTQANHHTAPILRRRSAAGVILGARLRHGGDTSLQQQLYALLRGLILDGRLGPGARLPSSRVVALELQVSRNTVMAAFDQLQSEGYVVGRIGSGTRVNEELPEALLESRRSTTTPVTERALPPISNRGREVQTVLAGDSAWLPTFSPGLPSVAEFPFALWSRLLAAEWLDPGPGALDGHPGGYWPLRECIAEYVGTARGIPCDADQVIMVTGNREGTELASRVLLDVGDGAVVEDPGYAGVRAALLASGARITPLRLDEGGLALSEVGPEHHAARMLLTAPSHQYPLGIATSLTRRLELIDWGHRHGCWIVEDDYDSEFRYSNRPYPSLYSLDPDGMVIYTGTFSKTIFPALRLGYLIVPKRLVTPFVRMKLATSGPVTLIAQRAMARFIEAGHFYQHVRKMRNVYAGRRTMLKHAIGQVIPELVVPSQEDAGLFLTTLLLQQSYTTPYDTDLTARLRQKGIHVEPLSPLYLTNTPRNGLVFGYGSLQQADLRRSLSGMASTLRELSRLPG